MKKIELNPTYQWREKSQKPSEDTIGKWYFRMVFRIFLFICMSDWALVFSLVLYFSPDRFWYPYIKFTTTFFGPIIGKPKFLILLEGDPKSANGCDFLAKTSENGFYQKNLGDPEVFIMFTPPYLNVLWNPLQEKLLPVGWKLAQWVREEGVNLLLSHHQRIWMSTWPSCLVDWLRFSQGVVSLSVSQSVSQSVSHSVSQSISQSVSQ